MSSLNSSTDSGPIRGRKKRFSAASHSSSTRNGGGSGGGEELYEMENHFVLRLPIEAAERVCEILNGPNSDSLKNHLSLEFNQDMRHATIKLDKKLYAGKLMDLPCIIETLKTLDRKNFYKVADVAQILICKSDTENAQEDDDKSTVSSRKKDKQFLYPHGITPPLKNVRKRRFRKTLKKKYMDAPELDKELKRLLRADLEAVNVKFEILTAEQERQQQLRERNAPQPIISAMDERQGKTPSSRSTAGATAAEAPLFSIPKRELSTIGESEVFGGRVSSSSGSDFEAESMARDLMASSSGIQQQLLSEVVEQNGYGMASLDIEDKTQSMLPATNNSPHENPIVPSLETVPAPVDEGLLAQGLDFLSPDMLIKPEADDLVLEEEESPELARQRLAILGAETELGRLQQQRLTLETEIRSLDNVVLRERMQQDIDHLLEQEEQKRTEVQALRDMKLDL